MKRKMIRFIIFSNSDLLALALFLWRTYNTFSVNIHTHLYYRMFGSTVCVCVCVCEFCVSALDVPTHCKIQELTLSALTLPHILPMIPYYNWSRWTKDTLLRLPCKWFWKRNFWWWCRGRGCEDHIYDIDCHKCDPHIHTTGTLWVIGHQVNSDQHISPTDRWSRPASE